jgi:hypothetical protein
MVDNLDVDILLVGNLDVDIIMVDNLEVDILMLTIWKSTKRRGTLFTCAFVGLEVRQVLHLRLVVGVAGKVRLLAVLELDVAQPGEVGIGVRLRQLGCILQNLQTFHAKTFRIQFSSLNFGPISAHNQCMNLFEYYGQ